MILALAAAAASMPIAVGTDKDIALLAHIARQCRLRKVRIGVLDSSPALYADRTGLYRPGPGKGGCFFGKLTHGITKGRFSAEFGFVGNAARD